MQGGTIGGNRPGLSARSTFLSVAKSTIRAEGIRGLYRGFGAVILGGTPGTVLYLTSYEKIKTALEDSSGGRMNFAVHFASGILAEAVSCIVYVPVDVCKERLQVQSSTCSSSGGPKYKGSVDAFLKISKNEGMRGIYKGYGATLLSYGPFSAFYFLFYEYFKKNAMDYYNNKNENGKQKEITENILPFHLVVATSAAAGSIASWITSPLDMAKLRLQVQRGGLSDTKYRNIGHGLAEIYKEGGLRLMWRGAGARVAFHAPSTALTITTFEQVKKAYDATAA